MSYRTNSGAQASALARAMASERDANKRVRLLSHLLLTIGDLDKGASSSALLLNHASELEERVQLLDMVRQELGIKLADPERVLTTEEVGQ